MISSWLSDSSASRQSLSCSRILSSAPLMYGMSAPAMTAPSVATVCTSWSSTSAIEMLKLRLSFSLRLCTTRRLSFSDSAAGMSMLNCNTPMCIMAVQLKQGRGGLWSDRARRRQRCCRSQRALDEVDREELELVALSDVVVVGDREAALEVRLDLSDVVLE